jgi:Fe-S-cluster containining protein
MRVSYSLIGWVRYLRLKVLGKQVIVRGRCRQCGACCRRMNLDIGGSWVFSVRRFKSLVRDNPAYARFEIIGRDWNGLLAFACTWLQEDGTCRDYANRLEICETYPHRELYFTNGLLFSGCGYRFEEVVCFERLLKKKARTEQTQVIHHFEV